MADILIVFIIFMTPVALFFTQRYFRLREKQLEAQSSGKLLAASSELQDKRMADLQARVENLESILIDMDSSPRSALAAREARQRALSTDTKEPRGQLPAPAAAKPTDADE